MSSEPAVADAVTNLPTGTWTVDKVHSSVEFQVKHLGIATVKGQFTEFEGTLEAGARRRQGLRHREGRERRHARAPARRAPALGRLLRGRDLPGDHVPVDRHPPGRRGHVRARGRSDDPRRHPAGEAESGDRGHRDRPAGQRPRRPLGRRRHQPLGPRHEVQRGARLGQHLVSDKVKILLDISAVKAA